MAPAGFSGRRQFDVACGVLSRCVRAEAATSAPPPTMLLMPGADVTPDVREEPEAATPPPARRLMTIMYGDRVLVFDYDFPSYRVAELVLVAQRPDVPGRMTMTTTDIPVARKASLQRFMEKRRDRLVARAPYAAAARPASSSNKEWNDQGEQDAANWLGLGVPGGCESS